MELYKVNSHIELSRKAAGEGMVLLKNNGTLPLAAGTKIALFGQASLNYLKGGGGSGDVYCKYVRNIFEGFKIKEQEGKVQLFHPLETFYKEFMLSEQKRIAAYMEEANQVIGTITDVTERDNTLGEIARNTQIQEPEIPQDLYERAAAFADAAIITIHRKSGEGWDWIGTKGDFYLTGDEESLIHNVKSRFKKCLIILNVSSVVDSNWFKDDEKIDAVLLGWQAGMEGGLAIADIFCGDVNPSGKLTDTFAKTILDYPSSAGFNASDDYVCYNEDIYVGYRYFETIPEAYKKVNYPFGHGLSYTTFQLSNITCHENPDSIQVCVDVTNIGNISGKEVVQIYYSAPTGKLGKPSKELAAFQKTKLLEPNETQRLELIFNISDMASYDDLGKIQKSAYILEEGSYEIYVGTSVRNVRKLDFTYQIDEKRIVEQLKGRCEPCQLKQRMLSDGRYEELPLRTVQVHYGKNEPFRGEKPEKLVQFDEIDNSCTLEEFVAQMTDEELCDFLCGKPNIGVSNTGCFAGVERLNVPVIPTADGPAGLRLQPECGILTTAWPCATLLACTWNEELLEEVGAAGAKEVKENHLGVWLTPGLNIHRSPLCGRNFEYYSEDPLISGKMAAALTRGIQSNQVACSVKHFACNNKERNRIGSDSRVSERALREIYLKGFEICVKEANPWTVMSSYNLLNGIHTSENYDLLTGILREEWGFQGMVTTDWGIKNNPINEVKAGNDMKMERGYPKELKEAIDNGFLDRADLEVCAKRILKVYMRIGTF